MKIDDLELEMAITDAMFRIKRDYERTNGQIYLSFSGGKDSTVLAWLIMLCELETNIPFVFSNTGIELDATLRFVKEFKYDNVAIVKPRKPFGQVVKEYGKPAMSKLKSEGMSTYQRHLDDPLKTARARQMITGEREKAGELVGGRNSYKIANKHMHFVHPDTEFKIANKCCQYMKKYPFHDFEKDNNMDGSFSGIRSAEGGTRSMAYQSCVKIKRQNNKEFVMSMPIIDWSDEMVNKFIEYFGIPLSDAYTVYDLNRTGCCACPFSKNLKKELKTLHDYEPKKYKAMLHWLRDVYIYQGVECDWDGEYMNEYNKMQPIIEKRNKEMMDKFRNKGDN